MGKRVVTPGILAALASVLLLAGAAAAGTPSEWHVPLTAATVSSGSNPNLEFGTEAGASDRLDVGIDVPHPPPPPGATLDAHFISADTLFPELDKDYRAPAESIRWTLSVQSSAQAVVLSWDSTGVPADVELRLTGPGLDTNMKAAGNTTLAAGTHSLTIAATWTPGLIPTPTPTPRRDGDEVSDGAGPVAAATPSPSPIAAVSTHTPSTTWTPAASASPTRMPVSTAAAMLTAAPALVATVAPSPTTGATPGVPPAPTATPTPESDGASAAVVAGSIIGVILIVLVAYLALRRRGGAGG